MSSWFRNIEQAPKDPILGVTEAFLADQSPNKINVGVVSPSNFRSLCFGSFFCMLRNSIQKEIEMKLSNLITRTEQH